MSEVKVNKISPRSGTAITLGDSGDTFTIPSGATLAIAGSVTGFTSAGIDDNATSVAITIDSSERVGIGTTSPSQKLHVNGHIVGNSLNIPSNTSSPPSGVTIHKPANDTMAFRINSTEKMRLTSTGLSIGTTESSAPIDVKLSSSNTNSVSNVMQIRHNTSGTAAAGFGTNIAFNGERADGNDQAMGKIGFVATNNTSTDMSSAFTIGTANAGVNAERMRVEPSGRVRIGNTSSTGHGNIYNLIVGNESSGGDAGILIVSPNNENAYFGFGDDGGVPCSLNYNHGSNFLRTYVNGSEAMRIDSSGNVGIGETAPLGLLHVKSADSGASANSGHNQVIAENSGNSGMTILSGNTSNGAICFGDDGNNCIGYLNYTHNGNHLDFGVNGSEAMRIDSSGRAMIGTTTADGILKVSDANNETYLVVQNAKSGGSGEAVLSLKNDVGNYQVKCFTDDSFRIRDNTNATDRLMISSGGTVFVSNTSEPSGGDNGAQISNGSYHIFCRNTSGSSVFRTFGSSGEFRTLGNGNTQNTNGSYGSISDRELKENEVDANSQWNDIKALQIKNYNLKSQPNQTHLGVIAQDLEASGMNGLVENNQDELYTEDDVLPEGKNIGDVKLKSYKSVKYSILYMKSVKALQEAMERIETLEAKVTALETTTP